MVAAPVLSLRRDKSGPLLKGIVRAPDLPVERPEGLPRGRIIELAAGPDVSRTTAAAQILLQSQIEGDPVAWVQPRGGAVFPPDLAAAGLDLGALLFVHVPAGAGRAALPKAAELLLRTGAFGALLLDVDGARLPRGQAWMGRLGSLARDKDCRCVILGSGGEGSLGPLVATRLRARRRRLRPGRFRVETEILKDKTGTLPSLPGPARYAGPEGLP